MFRSSTIIRELVLSLAKVILKHSVKLCPYRLCGGLAACVGVVCVLCAVQNSAQHKTHKSLKDMLPHHHIRYNDVFYRVF
jgi:hypothetical protein